MGSKAEWMGQRKEISELEKRIIDIMQVEQKKEKSSEDRYQRPSTGEDQLANSDSLLYL